ncbi:MAG: metal-dependent hydrolase [Nanoarchaeota archaeon]|nr:metal-dependent hydrolase [Nanoarchaeota archaeon]
MQKYTHLLFALLFFLLLNQYFRFPLYLAVFAFIGATVPDIDLKIKSLHRKLLHNIWTPIIISFILLQLNLIDQMIAIIFSIGFLSHLLSDSLTHMGIMPLWPITKPKFNGPFRTGGLGEFGILAGMLIILFFIIGII